MRPPLDSPVRWLFDSPSGPVPANGKSKGWPRSIARNVSRDRYCLIINGRQFDGDNHLNDSPRIRVPELQFPAEFLDPLPHPADAYADAVGPELRNTIGNALAIVADSDDNLAVLLKDRHPSFARAGVPKHIGESLLHDTENSRFQFRRDSWKTGRLNIKICLNPAAF